MVENATTPVYSATLLGSTATYTCNVGLGIIGSSVVVCQLSGWEATPHCETGEIVQCLFIKYSRHIPIVHIQFPCPELLYVNCLNGLILWFEQPFRFYTIELRYVY